MCILHDVCSPSLAVLTLLLCFFFPMSFLPFFIIWNLYALNHVLCARVWLWWPSLPPLAKPSFLSVSWPPTSHPTTDRPICSIACLLPVLSAPIMFPHIHPHPRMLTTGMYDHPLPSITLYVTFAHFTMFWYVLHSSLVCVFDLFACVFWGVSP